MGIPLFQQSLEQSRADVAGANLRSIWSAQRLYWLENRTYAPDLPTAFGESDRPVAADGDGALYLLRVASDGSSFTATATRTGTSSWSGSFTIAADGSFSGSVQQSGGATIVPGFQ